MRVVKGIPLPTGPIPHPIPSYATSWSRPISICKTRKKFNEMQDGVAEALTQIKDKRYEKGILDEGYAGVISFSVCFCKKSAVFEVIS